MSNEKQIPPPPEMPPPIEIKKDFCLFHKGQIKGEIYECKKCSQLYCLECAKKASLEGKSCIKCKLPFFL